MLLIPIYRFRFHPQLRRDRRESQVSERVGIGLRNTRYTLNEVKFFNSLISEAMPGAVENRIYRVGLRSVRLETAPTGPGGNIELPNYFLKLHTDRGTKEKICWISLYLSISRRY